ncbi:MAG: hypothetical protein ABI675_16525 [Chitinophagaceae bacterium]
MKTPSILVIFLTFLLSCKKQSGDPTPPQPPPRLFPTVSIDSIFRLEFDDISIAASYQNPGADSVLKTGFCWGTSQNPDTTNLARTILPVNSFSDTINDVGRRKTFYFRAFIKTSDSVYYSQNATIVTGDLENDFYKEVDDGTNRGIIEVLRSDDNHFIEFIQVYGNQYSWPQVAKIDLAGNVEWKYEYNPGESRQPSRILKVQDGYLFATIKWMPGARGVFVTKIDLNGSKIWEKSFNRKTSQEFVRIASLTGTTVILTTKAFDGITADGIRSNCSINDFVIDLNGNLISEKEAPVTNKFTQGSYAFYTASVPNDGFVTTNYFSSSGPADVIVQKYDSQNQLTWEQMEQVEGSDRNGSDRENYPMGLFISKGGNYNILGYTPASTESRAWLMEVDKNNGNKVWEYLYDKNKYGFHIYTIPYGFYQNTAGQYFVTGTLSDNSFPGANTFLLKLNEAGKKQWSHAYQNPKGPITRANVILTEGTNGIYVFGSRIENQSSFSNSLFVAKFTEY